MTATTVQPQRGRRATAPHTISIVSAGLMALLIGGWAGAVPYVAPSFGYSLDGSAAWTWNLAHTLLFLVPGGAAFLAGIMIMVGGLSTSPARRTMLDLAGLLAAVSGAWLVVGPFAWPVLGSQAFIVAGATSTHELIQMVMYSLGTGGLLLVLGAFVLGRPRSSSPGDAVAPVLEETVLPQMVVSETVVSETVVAETDLPETVVAETDLPETVAPQSVVAEPVAAQVPTAL